MAVIWSKCLINVQFMFDALQGFFSWWLTTGEQEGSGLYSNIIFLFSIFLTGLIFNERFDAIKTR